MTRVGFVLAGCLLLYTASGPLESRQATEPMPATFARLLKAGGFNEQDFQAIAQGKGVAKLVPAAAKDQAGATGAIRIDAPIDRLIAMYRDIERFETGEGTFGIGRFSSPPTVADMASMTLPPADLADLRECEQADCDMNLSQVAIERLKNEMRSSAPGTSERAAQVIREMLVDYLKAYQKRGNDALVVYGDREQPMSLRESSLRLLRDSRSLYTTFPDTALYFERYPHVPLRPGEEEFFYWSQLSFGMKPITRVNHVVIASATIDGRPARVIVSRTIYASHYFRDGLEIRFAVPARSVGHDRGFLFVATNRSHSESLTGFKGWLIGGKIRSSVRTMMDKYIRLVKGRVEA